VPALDAIWPLVGIIFIAYAVQTSIGFGSNLVSVALGALFFTVEEVVICVVTLSTLQSTYICARHHASIAWPVLLKRVIPIMGAGMFVGALGVRPFAGPWLDVGVAVMIVIVAILGVRALIRGPVEREPAREDEAVAGVSLLIGGIIHGVAAVGGPPLVYALERLRLQKSAFRSTLAVVWLLLNFVLLGIFFREGKYEDPTPLLALMPSMVLGIVAGELVFTRLPPRAFHAAVNIALLCAAIAVVARMVLNAG
jgi:uncharacterized membrane protein YfcA